MTASAHLVLTLDRASGRWVQVSIWSSPAGAWCGSVAPARSHLDPAGWRVRGEDYEKAHSELCAMLQVDPHYWGPPGAPLREAIDRLATGEACSVPVVYPPSARMLEVAEEIRGLAASCRGLPTARAVESDIARLQGKADAYERAAEMFEAAIREDVES